MENEDELTQLIGRIPACCSASGTPELQCCCGSNDCAYLKHNCLALEQLEGEIRTAGKLGQALLARHEQYMHDAERDRLEMSAKIETLEGDKKNLEALNAKTIEENRELLDQLEELNGGLVDSETHVKSLEATLQSTRMELKRLETLASRTVDLEIQLATLEQEHELLQNVIVTTEEQERSAIQRWKKAERRLGDVHEQLERIEREAREEKERHVEVLGRMERQRVVERELDTAAGRLKGAAAVTTGNGKNGKNGSNVISHFVKDILQDNANLQIGIVELREMLMNSNDEVQMLREQLLLHQPAEEKEGEHEAPTLRAELAPKERPEPSVISQAFHIHHHYHAPKREEVRRPKKKRTSINTSMFTPPQSIQSPRTSRGQDTANTILSQTSVSIPGSSTPDHRWSMQSAQMSDFAPSSVPSSPQSMYRHSALFDRGFDLDSRPTSPGSSVDPMSPGFKPYHRKRGSEVSTRSFIPSGGFQPQVIHEEEDVDVEDISDLQTHSASEKITSNESPDPNPPIQEDWTPAFQPTLRRSTSHESILSISGIDIHTLKSRPSQLTITRGNALRPPLSLSTVSVDTITSSSLITARPTLSRHGHDSSSYLRSSMLANGIPINTDNRSVSSGNSSHSTTTTIENSRLSSKIGGWVFGRWGVSPAKSTIDFQAPPATIRAQKRIVSTPTTMGTDSTRDIFGRPPGINQKGPIPGFVKKNERAPSQVRPRGVDHDALREVLSDGMGT